MAKGLAGTRRVEESRMRSRGRRTSSSGSRPDAGLLWDSARTRVSCCSHLSLLLTACSRPSSAAPTSRMAEPTWQETLRLRLVERNARESTYAPIIEQCTCIFVASDLPRSGFITIL